MTSPGRYQSRLFNTLSRQGQRLKIEAGRAIRHVKSTVALGVQALLYPAYCIFQASRLVNRQLQGAVQHRLLTRLLSRGGSPAVATPSADSPIQQVLEAACGLERSPANPRELQLADSSIAGIAIDSCDRLKGGAELTERNPTQIVGVGVGKTGLASQPRTIRGIAASISTRQLVLVAPDNAILDILSPQQQELLQWHIASELANYWQCQRLAAELRQPFAPRIQLPASRKTLLLPPVRAFWEAMAWVQSGPLAGVANLFQEASLPSSPLSASVFLSPTQANAHRPPSAFLLPPPPLRFIDRAVARLETRPLVPPPVLSKSLARHHQQLSHWVTRRSRLLSVSVPTLPDLRHLAGEEVTHQQHFRDLIAAAFDSFCRRRSDALSAARTAPHDLSGSRGSLTGPTSLLPTGDRSTNLSPDRTNRMEELPDRGSRWPHRLGLANSFVTEHLQQMTSRPERNPIELVPSPPEPLSAIAPSPATADLALPERPQSAQQLPPPATPYQLMEERTFTAVQRHIKRIRKSDTCCQTGALQQRQPMSSRAMSSRAMARRSTATSLPAVAASRRQHLQTYRDRRPKVSVAVSGRRQSRTTTVAPRSARTPTSAAATSPHYIDVGATSLGYEHTPLEQGVAHLDRTVRWLEDTALGSLHRLRQSFASHRSRVDNTLATLLDTLLVVAGVCTHWAMVALRVGLPIFIRFAAIVAQIGLAIALQLLEWLDKGVRYSMPIILRGSLLVLRLGATALWQTCLWLYRTLLTPSL